MKGIRFVYPFQRCHYINQQYMKDLPGLDTHNQLFMFSYSSILQVTQLFNTLHILKNSTCRG
jgi:hypothetical protein